MVPLKNNQRAVYFKMFFWVGGGFFLCAWEWDGETDNKMTSKKIIVEFILGVSTLIQPSFQKK